MSAGPIVEIVQGKLKEGVKREDFLKAADGVMPDLRAMSGFIRRELWVGEDGEWVDIVYWNSMDEARRAGEVFITLPSAQPFEAVLDASTVTMKHLEPVRKYD